MLINLLLIVSAIKKCESGFTPFIIGAETENILKFPQAVFIAAETKESQFICGSSIINQLILLTAGHCLAVFKLQNGKVTAFAGGGDIREAKSIRLVQQMLIHEHYTENSLTNDIGLLKLTRPLTLGESIKRTLIPKIFPSNVEVGTITGWGVINDTTGETSTRIRSLKQKIQSKVACEFLIGHVGEVFCAGSIKPDRPRPSIGDSGSVFIVKRDLQVGILSFRPHHSKAMSVYTNTTAFYDWIQLHTQLLYCND